MKWNTLSASTAILYKEWVHFVVDSLFIVAQIVLWQFCGWHLLLWFCTVLCLLCLCKPVLSGPTRRPKIGFPDKLSLSEGFKYCRML